MKQIIKFIKKAFGSLNSRIKIPFELIVYHLSKVAKCQSYMETFSKQSDSLHKWIKSIYEEDLKRAFELEVRKVIKTLRISAAELAFDVTKEPFYGKARNLYIFNTDKSKNPYSGEFHYLTCCLINKGKQIPLMALPVRYGEHTKLTIELLEYCQSLFKRIKHIIFDRGYYNAELIDYLLAHKLPYLILVPAHKGKLTRYRNETTKFHSYTHIMRYSKDKSTWKPKTSIVVCKQTLGYDWMFATNIQLHNPNDYVFLYKRRWQIETNYRVQDEAKIKSKSSNYMIRYFYFLMGHLLHLYWIVHKKFNFYVQFKKYLDLVELKLFYDFLDVQGL